METFRKIKLKKQKDEGSSDTSSSMSQSLMSSKSSNIMNILTEAEKLEIKYMIGTALLTHLRQVTIRLILQKEMSDRTEQEIDRLICFLKSVDFFRNQANIGYVAYRELAQCLTYREYQKGQIVYMVKEEAKEFFLILTGTVEEVQKNEAIN